MNKTLIIKLVLLSLVVMKTMYVFPQPIMQTGCTEPERKQSSLFAYGKTKFPCRMLPYTMKFQKI